MSDWSPNGRVIAVAWGGRPTIRPNGLYLIDTVDWSIQSLYVPADSLTSINCSTPSWSPGGEWLAFSYGHDIYKIKRTGDSLTQLTDFGEQYFCDWSPADTLIASVESSGSQVGTWIYSPDGLDAQYLIPLASNPAFLTADSLLYIRNSRTNVRDSAEMVLRSLVDGGERIVLKWDKYGSLALLDHPVPSPDGQRIVCSAQGRIVTMSLDGDSLQVLTERPGQFPYCQYPSWSPDGLQIMYNVQLQGGGGLWIMNSDGSNKRQIPGW